VAGRYQPLADDVTIAGDVRPNLSSAVGSEDKAKRTLDATKRRFASTSTPKRVAATAATPRALTAGNRRALPGDFLLTSFSNAVLRSDFSMRSRR
jgi:hypothetical protein